MTTLTVVNGSPRKNGNTEILLDQVAKGYTDSGGRIRQIRLHDSGIEYCTGCFTCLRQRERPCKLNDPMDGIYDELLGSGAIVLGTPVYFWGPSAQMKTFLDRLFPFGDYQTTTWAQAFRGVPFGLVLVYGDEDPITSGAEAAYRQIKLVIECIGGTIARLIHCSANDLGEIRENEQALQAAEDAGAFLYGYQRHSINGKQG
ncbi:MAG: flavodoxin family protein [Spirochaetaceae bacterium]|nr:MAG: flavodoxin family protein [Spirochaetaceae bacterium]